MSIRPRRSAGFTLLEILIAIGILAIGLVSVFSLFPLGIYAVKDTVETTRAAGMARSARSELAAYRADLAITGHNSAYYDPSPAAYVPFGPWEKPWDLRIWRSYLYEYIDNNAPTVLHRRVLFDDRTMLPVSLRGTFDGTQVLTVDPGSLTRDADLLEMFYDEDGVNVGPNMYAPWEIRLRVRGVEFLINDRWYVGSDLDTITVADPGGLMTGAPAPGDLQLPFEILLPVALKDLPVDVPLEWAGGLANFTGGAGPIQVSTAVENRNLCNYLIGNNNPGLGGWISVDGDWFQVDARSPAPPPISRPANFTLKSTYPYYPPLESAVPFKMVLPVVTFSVALLNPGPDTQTLPVIAGGGQQLGFLEAGAFVEVVLDGGIGDFNPVVAEAHLDPGITRLTVMNVERINPDTDDFIAPGNFIRIGGRDYEIDTVLADLDSDGNFEFDLVGTVPAMGGDVNFKIVLGYDPSFPGQLPQVARFPVRSVRRTPTVPPPPIAYPVTSFEVGRDANGNLPADLFLLVAAPDPFHNPVQILPANRSTYAYHVTAAPNSPAGVFVNGNPTVTGPSQSVQTPQSNPFLPIPFPPDINPTDMGVPGDVFSLRTLSLAEAAGVSFPADITANAADYTTVTLDPVPTFNAIAPFHAYDGNDFDTDLAVGDGTYIGVDATTGSVSFTPSPPGTSSPNAIFIAGDSTAVPPLQSLVQLDGAFGTAKYPVTWVDTSLDWFEIDISGAASVPNDNDVVTVTIPATAAPPGEDNFPLGRGRFVEGSDAVIATYADTAGSFPDVPDRGLPYGQAMQTRYNLQVGDYIGAPDGAWYAVKAINNDLAADFIILDRPYEGTTSPDLTAGDYFQYRTPIREAYSAQVASHRNYRLTALRDATGARDFAAAFGFDSTGAGNPMRVHLAVALPPDVKPGDYIRADGDASHPAPPAPILDPGLLAAHLVAGGDLVDGDRRWYMIDAIGPNVQPNDLNYRTEITLTSPYRGYVPTGELYQPASVSPSVLRTYDTVIGAF